MGGFTSAPLTLLTIRVVLLHKLRFVQSFNSPTVCTRNNWFIVAIQYYQGHNKISLYFSNFGSLSALADLGLLLSWSRCEQFSSRLKVELNFFLFLTTNYVYTPIPILKLHALHKQYTDYPTLASEYEEESLYKN